MAEDFNDRFRAASRFISQGEFGRGLAEARALATKHPANPLVRMNCAGLFIDAGQGLGEVATVQDGVEILALLLMDERVPPQYRMSVRYNLANGKSTLIKLLSADGPGSEEVRDMRQEEEVVSLYYDSSDFLRSAPPEHVINCAAMLRIEARVHEAIDLLDDVLRQHPDHPHAHMKMAEMLWCLVPLISHGGVPA